MMIWKAFKELFSTSKRMFLASYGCTLLQGLSRILPIVTLQRLLDALATVRGGSDFPHVLFLLGLFAGARIFCRIVDLITNYLYEYYTLLAGFGMENLVNKRVYSARGICFETPLFLEQVNKAYRGTQSIRSFIDTWMLVLLLYLPEMAVIILYLVRANRFLPLILLVIAVPCGILLRLQEKEFAGQEERVSHLQRVADVYNDQAFSVKHRMETIAVGYVSLLNRLLRKNAAARADAEYQYQRKKNGLENLEQLVLLLGHGAVFAILALCTAQGVMTIGLFAALITSLDELFDLIDTILSILSEGVSEELEKIRNYFLVKEQIEQEDTGLDAFRADHGVDLKENKSKKAFCEKLETIKLEDVSFRYPSGKEDALRHVTVSLPRGEHIAIVGENGSGKSTLVKVLAGIYDLLEGRVMYNDTDLQLLQRPSVYQRITAVFQKFGRYALSLADNICLNQPEDPARLRGVRAGRGMEPLNSVPERTLLSREFGGTELSGGQWQRVAIARAWYRGGELCLLDEPTSAIDPEEEKVLFDLFSEMTRGRTSVIVTHRMGAVSLADRIIVMKQGSICGVGTHKELLTRCTEYQRLWNAQAQSLLG